jgi:hypothetical protein
MHTEGPDLRAESEQSRTSEDDAWLDEVLKETFPASDPIPWRHKEVDVTRVDAPSGSPTSFTE